jgi:hypothetical protein
LHCNRDHGAGQCWIDRVEVDRPRTQPLRIEPRLPNDSVSAENVGGEAIFHDEGDFWTIAYLGHSVRLRDVRGLHYIAYLLAHPNERFHVRDLAAIAGGEGLGSAYTAEPRIEVAPHSWMGSSPTNAQIFGFVLAGSVVIMLCAVITLKDRLPWR